MAGGIYIIVHDDDESIKRQDFAVCTVFAHHGLGAQPVAVTSRSEMQHADALLIWRHACRAVACL